MAAKKSDKYSHQWPDGTWHSIPWEQTKRGQADAANRVTNPPAGSYDPNLDFQEETEKREYGYTGDDINKAQERAGIDLGLGTERTRIDKGRTEEDYGVGKAAIERGAGRSLSDLLTSRTRNTEDYGTSLASLQRSYDRLANTQGEQTRKMGVDEGGAVAQAARKRAANQALDKAPIDQAYQRFMQDSTTSETRLGEDKQTSLDDLLRGRDRTNDDLDWNQAERAKQYDWTTKDLGTQQERADDAHDQFGRNIFTAKQVSWGGPAVTGTGAPATTIKAPTPTQPSTPTSSPAPTSITAGPGVPGTKKKKGKNRVVTYSNSVGGP